VAIAGAAIDEPVVRMGPFVMNSREAAEQAMRDYSAPGVAPITLITAEHAGSC
jgi:redox-sensitive bicupin YhaK (pirin superfamily)